MGAHTTPTIIEEPNIQKQKPAFDKKELAYIEEEITQILYEADITMQPILRHIFTSGGKRLRPMLIIKSACCFNQDKNIQLIKAAVAFELIHMASLVHDDIIDMSEKRHGTLTVNLAWGIHRAVLIGDYLFARALGILRSFNLLSCLEEAINSIEQMSEGEIQQYHHKFDINTGIETYFQIIYKKTACLISNCCKCGAIIANASDDQIELLENFGLNLGYAFQITDDMLDFIGQQELLGKPVGHDIVQGQVTLPLILLNSNIKYGELISNTFHAQSNNAQFSALLQAVRTSNAIKKCNFIASLHIEKAKSALTNIPLSDSRTTLETLADNLLQRTT